MKMIRLELLRLPALDDTLLPVLESIGAAISKCWERVEAAHESGPEEWADIVQDEEAAIVEALLGAALVSAQATLVGVYSRASDMIGELDQADAAKLPFQASKGSMYRFGERLPAGLPHAAAINALANYFKHGDEWGPWAQETGQSQPTIQQIRQLGLEQGSTGNMRTGAEALGWDGKSDLSPIFHAVRGWSQGIFDEVRAAFPTDSGE